MTADGLFHIDDQGQLVSMLAASYEAEEVLQELLSTHPDLLAGGQMTPEEPRRWVLVKREYGVPDREEGSGRWSIDHLFVDQDAVPTLVEVKRSSDTRIRREVVGQMLDYAANGVRYWPSAEIRTAFEATHTNRGVEPQRVVTELLNDDAASVEEFFARVADNLRAGRIRLVFVADSIPDELRRIVEFLNEQMSPADVLAVEVKQYRAEGHQGRIIVPAVYGRTAVASAKRGLPRTADPQELFSASDAATREVVDRFQAMAEEPGFAFRMTSAGAQLRTPTGTTVAQVYTYDRIEIPLQPLRHRGLNDQAEALWHSLEALTAKPLTPAYPSIPTVDALHHWDQFSAVLQRLAELRGS